MVRAQKLDALHIAGHVFASRVVEIEINCLSGIAPQMLHPFVPRSPRYHQRRGQKQAPWEQPYAGAAANKRRDGSLL